MKLFKILTVISFVLVPTMAFAWGPLTHTYLGNELFSLASLLPGGIAEVIRRYRKDFIYGNLMADIIVGKKYLPAHKNSTTGILPSICLKLPRQNSRRPLYTVI